jgi:hypothetical protein
LINVDRGLAQGEQLVDQSSETGQEKSNSPGTYGVDRLVWIVSWRDNCANLNVGRVVDDEGSLEECG